jgi:hypothetical protein
MVIFFAYTVLLSFIAVRLILIPAFQLLKIGKIIGHEQAARIVGSHFSEIQDKLLNTLQLIEKSESQGDVNSLLMASIEQKTQALKVFRFAKAIDFRKNFKYLRIAAIPVDVILLLIVISPKIISEPATRLVHYNEKFIKPFAYKLELLNRELVVLQQGDFEVQVKISGEEIPADVFIKTGDIRYKMTRDKGFNYSHRFKSVQANIKFRILAGELESEEFTLVVVPKPIILNFDLVINYPAYTGRQDEVVENQGDVVIPEGTAITWRFYTKDVDEVNLNFYPEILLNNEHSGNKFSFTGVPLRNCNYTVKPVNTKVTGSDSLRFRIMVVNDGYPSIFVTESADSVLQTNLFFKGTLKDDYGFTRLTFNYSISERDDSVSSVYATETLDFDRRLNNQIFYHSVDLVKLLTTPGKSINYYFEITDNDGFNGPKTARSELRTIATPTLEEIAAKTEQVAEDINDEIEKNIKDAKNVKKSIDELNKKLVNQNSLTWQDKKKLEDILKANEAVQKRIEDIKKKASMNIENEEKYLETSDRILEKQKALNEMMDQLFPEELKKMIEELKALMNQVDKEKLGNLLDKMKMSNKDLENQLDRNLALMKQIEFDRQLEDVVNNLKKSADDLDKLAEKTEKETSKNDDLLNEQKKIEDKVDSLNKKIDKLKKDGKDLEEPVDLGNTEKLQDSIGQNLKDSKEGLEGKKNKKAAGSQKKASENMKDLAQQMESAGQESEEGQLEEDAQNIRMILENLVRLSFDQEDLINKSKSIVRTDPRYLDLVLRQKEFGDKMKIVEDSLVAISKRQLMIKPIVTREIAAINNNITLAVEAFESRNLSNVVTRQQYAMTSINNLALLLAESLQKMNEQMSSSMQSKGGSKSCNNPNSKGGKKSAKDMKDLQAKIGEQLKKLKEGMEGSKKQGTSSKSDQQGLNKEVAKLAAQQEALRNAMQKYQEELGSQGIKSQNGLNEAVRDMEQIEKDLVNKNISQETMKRQQRILSRLLESEKAEQTREREERRESTEATNQKISNLGQAFEYNRTKRGSEDQLQLALPAFNSFYKTKVNGYIVKIEK